MKRIKSQSDLTCWQNSPSFKELNEFINNLSCSICGKNYLKSPAETESKCLNWIAGLVDKVDALVDEIEPIEEVNKSAQRYGNKSFRTLIERINVDIILLDSGGSKGFNEFLSKCFGFIW